MLINWQREQERESKIILKGNLWGYFLKEVFLHKQMEFQATVNEGCGKDFLITPLCLRSVNRGFHLYFPCACIVHEGFAPFPLISATWRTSRGCRLGKLTETPPAENPNENRTGCAGANVWKGFELLTTTQRFGQKYIEKLQHRPRNWREGGNSFIFKRNPTQLRFSFSTNKQTNKTPQSAKRWCWLSSTSHSKWAAELSLRCNLPVRLISSSCEKHPGVPRSCWLTGSPWPTSNLRWSNCSSLFCQLRIIHTYCTFRTSVPVKEKLTR